MSKIIKASFANHGTNDKKLIEIKNYFLSKHHQQTEEDDIKHKESQAEFILQNAKQEAESLRKDAERFYESVQQQIIHERKQWETERERLEELARKEGYALGLKQGEEAGFAQYKQLIAQARGIVESANGEFYKKVDEASETIFLIGLKIAERILSQRLNENYEHFIPLVKRAIKEVREHSEVKIYVHPSVYEILVQRRDELELAINREIDIFVYPDDQLAEYGCIIESPYGRIDASIDTQLQQLKEKLLERFENKEE